MKPVRRHGQLPGAAHPNWKGDAATTHAKRVRRFRDRHPEKVAAHRAIEKAIAKGELTRQPREKCAAPGADAHHDDYSKPFEIRWLCRSCHSQEHADERLAALEAVEARGIRPDMTGQGFLWRGTWRPPARRT